MKKEPKCNRDWGKMRRALSAYLDPQCRKSRDQFKRDLGPFIGCKMYPSSLSDGWFMLEGVQIMTRVTPTDSKTQFALLVGTSPIGLIDAYIVKRATCWFSNCYSYTLRKMQEDNEYKLVSPKLAAEILARELIDEQARP